MKTANDMFRRAWPRLKQAAPWILALLVLSLLARQIQTIDWPEVWQALLQQSPVGMAIGAGLALLSYALVASYDLVGRHETQHGLPAGRCVRIASICYAFNLNFGSLVGALALKLRLYGSAGLKMGTVGRVIALTVTTNWLGFLFLGGLLMALAPPPIPPQVPLPDLAVRGTGALLTSTAVAYVLWCAASSKRRHFSFRGHDFELPAVRVALWQLAVSSANWALMGLIVWLLLQQKLPYTDVLGVLLIAAVAGVITHVPAGLGVLEAVFVAAFAGQMPNGQLLAALLAYRTVYYLIPLALAAVGYALIQREKPAAAHGAAPAPQALTTH